MERVNVNVQGEKIQVTSDLRARDVPVGTRVTPRGREYMLLGLLGGWMMGGGCLVMEWRSAGSLLSVITILKVFGAATLGSLLGTLVSWVMPGTRKRMRVIREMKVHIEEERKAEARAVRAAVDGEAELSAPILAVASTPAATPSATPPVEAVRPATEPDVQRPVSMPPAHAAALDALVRTPAPVERASQGAAPAGDAQALLEAIGEYSASEADDPQAP